MALKLSGKDDRLTRQDFLTLARTMELPVARAEEAISSIAAALREAVPTLALPPFAERADVAQTMAERVKAIVRDRAEAFP